MPELIAVQDGAIVAVCPVCGEQIRARKKVVKLPSRDGSPSEHTDVDLSSFEAHLKQH